MIRRNCKAGRDFTLLGVEPQFRRAFLRGWAEMVLGWGYCVDYDGYSIDEQFCYEFGRLAAANTLRAGGGSLPRGVDSVRECRAIEAIAARAMAKIGYAIPQERDA